MRKTADVNLRDAARTQATRAGKGKVQKSFIIQMVCLVVKGCPQSARLGIANIDRSMSIFDRGVMEIRRETHDLIES